MHFGDAQTFRLLDTDADISALNLGFFNKIGGNARTLQAPSISLIKGADDAIHKIYGEAILDMQLDNLQIKQILYKNLRPRTEMHFGP